MSLTANTQKILDLLDAIDALPEAGGGTADPVIQPLNVMPSETGQNFNADGIDGYKPVTVEAISKTYVGSEVPRKEGEVFRPGTDHQSIDPGQYLTGIQYILGDSNLKAENIKKGVTIFDVAGAFEGSGGSGGGLPEKLTAWSTGVYQPTENITTNQLVNHGLGVTPNFFIWWLVEDMSTNPVAGINICGALIGKNAKYSATSATLYTNHSFYRGYNNTPQVNGAASSNAGTTYMNATSCRMLCSTTYALKAGYTYRWIAGVVEGIQ